MLSGSTKKRFEIRDSIKNSSGSELSVMLQDEYENKLEEVYSRMSPRKNKEFTFFIDQYFWEIQLSILSITCPDQWFGLFNKPQCDQWPERRPEWDIIPIEASVVLPRGNSLEEERKPCLIEPYLDWVRRNTIDEDKDGNLTLAIARAPVLKGEMPFLKDLFDLRYRLMQDRSGLFKTQRKFKETLIEGIGQPLSDDIGSPGWISKFAFLLSIKEVYSLSGELELASQYNRVAWCRLTKRFKKIFEKDSRFKDCIGYEEHVQSTMELKQFSDYDKPCTMGGLTMEDEWEQPLTEKALDVTIVEKTKFKPKKMCPPPMSSKKDHSQKERDMFKCNSPLSFLLQLAVIMYWFSTGVALYPQRCMRVMRQYKIRNKKGKYGGMICVLKTITIFSLFSLNGVGADFCSPAGDFFPPCIDPLTFVTLPIFRVGDYEGPYSGNIKPLVSFAEGNFTDYRCYVNSVRSTVCESYVSNNLTMYVNGDANFNSQHQTSGDPRSCQCVSGQEIIVEVNEEFQQIVFLDVELFGIEGQQEDVMLLSTVTESHPVGDFNYTHHYEKDHQKYKFNSNDMSKKTIEIRKRHCFDFRHNVTTKETIKLGECFKKTIGPVNVIVRNSTQIIDRFSFRMREYSRCDEFPSLFSSNTNFACHKTWQKILYVLFWVVFGVACITFLVYLWTAISKGSKALKCKIEALKKRYDDWKDRREIKKENKKTMRRERSDEAVSEEEIIDKTEKEEIIPSISEREAEKQISTAEYMNGAYMSARRNILTGMRTLTIVMLLIGLAAACDLSVYTNSEITSCNINTLTNQIDCVPGQVVDVNFLYQGLTTCFNIQDNQNSTLESYKIELISAQIELIPGESYVTSSWKEDGQTNLRCKATSHCDTGTCGTLNYLSDKTFGGELSNPNCIAYPGIGRCEVLGTANPFTCGSETNCYYWCSALIPDENTAINVTMIGGYSSIAMITVRDQNDLEIGTLTLRDGQSEFLGAAEITFNGFKTIDFDNILPSYYNVFTDQMITVGSVRGLPEKNRIGDIQANSLDNLLIGDFVFANDIYISEIKNDHTDEIEVTYNNPGISNTDVPVIHSGDFVLDQWIFTNGTWKAEITRTCNADFSVLLPNTLIFSEQLNEVCPVIEHVGDASGCFDCDSGFAFNITAKSNCMTGSVTITCEDLEILNPLVNLGPDEKEFEIFGYSDKEKVDTTCKIGDVDFDLNGELSEISDYTKSQNNITTSNDKKDDYECSGDFIGRTFSGCGSWLDILGTIILFLVLAVFGVLGFIFLLGLLFGGMEFLMLIKQTISIYRERKSMPTNKEINWDPKDKEEFERLNQDTKSLSFKESMKLSKLRKKYSVV